MDDKRTEAINMFSGTTVPYRVMWQSIDVKMCALIALI